MDNILGVAMIDRLEERFHVASGNILRKSLVGLLGDLFEKLSSIDIFHDQVDVLLIVVRFVILDDIWMIERVKNRNLLHDTVNIVSQLNFIKNLNGDLEVFIMFVCCQEYATERTDTQYFGL